MDAVTLAIALLGLSAGFGVAFPYLQRAWRAINASNLTRWQQNQKRARAASRVFYAPGVVADNDTPRCLCGKHSAFYCNTFACEAEQP